MTRHLAEISCGVGVIRRGRQFLIAQRAPDDSFPLYWEFPGGKKDLGETLEDCVKREVREEVGIEVCVEKKIGEVNRKYRQKAIRLHFYLCSEKPGMEQTLRALDCAKCLWADVEELKNYQFPPANEKIIDRLVKEFG